MPRRAGEPVAVGARRQLVRRDAVDDVVAVEVRPRPFGKLTWPGCSASVISTGASTAPRRVTTRTRPPRSTPSSPRPPGSCAARRRRPSSATRDRGRSCSPSTSDARPPRARTGTRGRARTVRRQRRELLEQLGDHEADPAVGRVEAPPGLVVVVDGEDDAGRLARIASKSASPLGVPRALHRLGMASRSTSARGPTPRPLLAALAQRRAERLVEHDRRERRQVRLLGHRASRNASAYAARPLRGGRVQRRRGRRRCRRRAPAPAGGGSRARAACPAADRGSARAAGRSSPGTRG